MWREETREGELDNGKQITEYKKTQRIIHVSVQDGTWGARFFYNEAQHSSIPANEGKS